MKLINRAFVWIKMEIIFFSLVNSKLQQMLNDKKMKTFQYSHIDFQFLNYILYNLIFKLYII